METIDIQLGDTVKIINGWHKNKKGIVNHIFEAGELCPCKIFKVIFDPMHSGQFKETDLKFIARL